MQCIRDIYGLDDDGQANRILQSRVQVRGTVAETLESVNLDEKEDLNDLSHDDLDS